MLLLLCFEKEANGSELNLPLVVLEVLSARELIHILALRNLVWLLVCIVILVGTLFIMFEMLV